MRTFNIRSSIGRAQVAETQTLGSLSGVPAGLGSAKSASAISAFVTDVWETDRTFTWEPTEGNYGLGIGSMAMANPQSNVANTPVFQMSFGKVSDGTRIPKDATKRLTITTRWSWGRYP